VTQVAISKIAHDPDRFARLTYSFANARSAFKAYLLALHLAPMDEILLPAYIGWSSREGSGVFDPVEEVDARFRFYRLNRDLSIDLNNLQTQVTTGCPRLLVLIHYFGYPDPNLAEVVALARSRGILVLEDEAHALYSDWVGGVCGRYGDASIMSLHKVLPFESGGLLILNRPDDVTVSAVSDSPMRRLLDRSPLDYDLFEIARARRHNARQLLGLLSPLTDRAYPLFPTLPDGIIPQTLPVIIIDAPRDELYFKLNEAGYGVVSLYHTLIASISPQAYPESHWLARRILNLPVHQDIQSGQLAAMIACLGRLLE